MDMYIKSIFERIDDGSSVVQFGDKHGMFLEKNEFGHDFPLHDVND